MTRTIRPLLLFAILGVLLSACAAQPSDTSKMPGSTTSLPTVTVCLDLAVYGNTGLMDIIPGRGEDFEVVLDTVPTKYPERDAKLTRIRTEIMAGKGPDVFLCDCMYPYFLTEAGDEPQALFPFPEKAMKNRVFLPLDEYIQNSDTLEWDMQLPVIMDAGKNDEGQLLLPFSYTFSVAAFDREKYRLSEELPMTWEEMASSGDPLVHFAITQGILSGALGRTADYDRDEPTFTEDELLNCAELFWESSEAMRNGRMTELTEYNADGGYYELKDGVKYINFSSYELGTLKGGTDIGDSGREYLMVPVYNTSGGVTASVTAFAGVNRNTKVPDESFRVIEAVFSRSTQQASPIYNSLMGIPPHEDVGKSGSKFSDWNMNDWNYEQFRTIREQIDTVQFYTPLDVQLRNIVPEHFNTEQPMDKIVHRAYMTMRMLLAES